MLAAVFGLMFVIGAVGGFDEGDNRQATRSTAEIPGPEVPIPPGATKDTESRAESSIYRMSIITPYSEVEDFYDRFMPIGADWGGWRWCRESGPTSDSYWRVYQHADGWSLVVAINKPSIDYPVGIVVGYQQDSESC